MDYYKGSPSPKQVYNTKDIELRKIGLSGQKSAYVKNVAEFFISNEINKKMWKKMSDEEIIERLISIKGVGKWTVQMVLMFHLDRQDVLPLDDLIIKNTMIKLYKVKETGKEQKIKLEKIASKWSPYRSIACRYLWASKDFVL
jgi:DNA-3-methyladenine glycosylase II